MKTIIPRIVAVVVLAVLGRSVHAQDQPKNTLGSPSESGAHSSTGSQDIDPYPPSPLIGPAVYRWSFEKGPGAWKALHDCRVSGEDGSLKIVSTGEDPYAMAPSDKPLAGPLLARIRMRATTAGNGQFFWTSDRQPAMAAERCASFDLDSDGNWHEYSTLLDVDGSLTRLRLDPGSGPGHAEVAWIELCEARHYPLVVERLETTPTAVKIALRNRSDHPVEVRLAGTPTSIAPGAVADLVQSLSGNAAVEAVAVVVEVQGFPPLQRTVVVRRDTPIADWLTLRNEALTLRVAPDGSAARIERDGRPVALIAPLVMADHAIVKFPSPERQEHRLRLASEGIEAVLTLQGEQIEVSIAAGRPVEGPVVRPIGPLQQGLLAGLEYLGRGEKSSSKLDIETEEHLRFRPDRLKVTMPLMVCVTDRASVAVSWNDMTLQPTYASPNFVDGLSDEHRMSLEGEKIDAVIRVSSGDLEDAILWAVKRKGLPPLPPSPRDPDAQRRLDLAALQGPIAGPGGWGHCVEPKFPRAPHADMASAVWRLTGEAPALEKLVPGGSHIRNDAIYFVTGRAEAWLNQRRAEVRNLIKTQQADGSYRYQGKFQRGHDEDTASGWCAPPATRLLEFARATGDAEALAAGLKTLDYMKRFREPRGAQTWELSLHTPDILASAYLVWAYVRGYELTGKAEYLACARRWAISGIPFVYLWQCHPIMLYATPPVYGATQYRAPNWMGLPVQWCGGVYAYALALLAPHDTTLDWKHLAQGIYVAAQQIQYPDGPLAGCLPDVFHLSTQKRDGPSINPSATLSLQLILEGQLDSLAVAADAQHRVTAPYPVTLRDHRAHVRATPGKSYQILVDGQVVEVRQSKGEDPIELK
jgi:hypothetical protein